MANHADSVRGPARTEPRGRAAALFSDRAYARGEEARAAPRRTTASSTARAGAALVQNASSRTRGV
jgi:hypothetical protein